MKGNFRGLNQNGPQTEKKIQKSKIQKFRGVTFSMKLWNFKSYYNRLTNKKLLYKKLFVLLSDITLFKTESNQYAEI